MKENLGHLMIDIEAMGNKSQSVLCSIAAVEFSMETGETGRIFSEVASIQSSLDVGLKVNGDTINWWMEQEESARMKVISGKQHLGNMLNSFSKFIEDIGSSNLLVWGNSNRFDMGLIEDAYIACGKKGIPWEYSLERDVRTLVGFYPEIKKNTEFTGTKHDPVDDCLHQIKYCVETWNKVNNGIR